LKIGNRGQLIGKRNQEIGKGPQITPVPSAGATPVPSSGATGQAGRAQIEGKRR